MRRRWLITLFEKIIFMLSFHSDTKLRSCCENLQHVFLEILEWCGHWIIYNSEPYLNYFLFSSIHLNGQSEAKRIMTQTHRRLINQDFLNCKEQPFHLLAQNVSPQEWQDFQNGAPKYHALNSNQETMVAFAEGLEFQQPFQGNLLEISDRRLWTWSE